MQFMNREVEVAVDTVDLRGNFIGAMYFNQKVRRW